MTEIHCWKCKDAGEIKGEGCRDCCEHEYDPDEGYMCLNCGKEGAEEVLSRMYDRAKDERKYGK